jgi:hypothetical protein
MSNHWEKRKAVAGMEARGVVVEVPAYPGWKFTVRRRCNWNADYVRALARVGARPEIGAIMAKQRENADYELTPAERETDAAMIREAFAEGCISSWEGVTAPDGSPMDPAPHNAAKVLEHFPDIFEALRQTADDASRFVPPATLAVANALKAKAARGN